MYERYKEGERNGRNKIRNKEYSEDGRREE